MLCRDMRELSSGGIAGPAIDFPPRINPFPLALSTAKPINDIFHEDDEYHLIVDQFLLEYSKETPLFVATHLILVVTFLGHPSLLHDRQSPSPRE